MVTPPIDNAPTQQHSSTPVTIAPVIPPADRVNSSQPKITTMSEQDLAKSIDFPQANQTTKTLTYLGSEHIHNSDH